MHTSTAKPQGELAYYPNLSSGTQLN